MIIFYKRLFQLSNQYLYCAKRNICSTEVLSTKLKNFSKMSEKEFKGTEDAYNGIIVDSNIEGCNEEMFSEKLNASLNVWTSAKKNGIWFKIALKDTHWVPVLAKNGFDFHHAKNGYVMMYKWLANTTCAIPVYAHTMFAVGALIFNKKNEILIVKEKHFLRGHWKFPGGMLEPGESIIEAAMREVMEETNIKFEYETLVSFMHADKGTFGCSDFYILVAGKALTEDIIKCDREIDASMWIGIDEYLAREDVTPFNKEILNHYLSYKKNNITIGYTEGVHKISKRNYKMYSVHFHNVT